MLTSTPTIETERLILRRFTPDDLAAFFEIYRDGEVNRFLPWFPLKSMDEAAKFYDERYASVYRQKSGYAYAICLKADNVPVGYLHAEADGAHDFGYGLRKEFWGKGIMTEAGAAVIARLKHDGLPFITATHDVNNPRSGTVMQRLGMHYEYSYEEQWQPKNFPVIFRMYQLNLDGNAERVYTKYWDVSAVRFRETEI